MHDEFDYGSDEGAGFPNPRPITDAIALELRQEANNIIGGERLLESARSYSARNQLNKDLKEARRRFAYRLVMEHGIDRYTWPDGLTVRIESFGQRDLIARPIIKFSRRD